MSDQVDLNVASKESVAHTLTIKLAKAEGLISTDPDYRKKYLDLYAECLYATSGYRSVPD